MSDHVTNETTKKIKYVNIIYFQLCNVIMLCSKEAPFSGTSNLWKHLGAKHFNTYSKLQEYFLLLVLSLMIEEVGFPLKNWTK